MCSALPVLMGAAIFMSWTLSSGTSQSSDAYAQAGNIAQQCISAMRTVAAFGCEEREAARYEEKLILAENAGIKKAFLSGAGVVYLIIVLIFRAAFKELFLQLMV
jgi:ABC-type bacteriocin/lantibiotic exporter with double-glycine peptidase domain